MKIINLLTRLVESLERSEKLAERTQLNSELLTKVTMLAGENQKTIAESWKEQKDSQLRIEKITKEYLKNFLDEIDAVGNDATYLIIKRVKEEQKL